MADLIDRDILKASLRESYDELMKIRNGLKYGEERRIADAQLNTFAEAIMRAKEQPAVELVHCRDCRNWQPSGWCKLIGQEFDRWPGYFCADGVRKEGGNNG